MSFVRTVIVLLAFLSFVGFSQAFSYYGQQSINSDYYFQGIYHSPTVYYQQSPHWDYYSYNTTTPYPTLGGGSFYPSNGYTNSYPSVIVSNPYNYIPGYAGSYVYSGYANTGYGDYATGDYSYRNSGYGCTGFFFC